MEGGDAMNRLVMIICALVLVLGLSDDGRFGQAKTVAPESPVKSLGVSSDYHGLTGPDCQDAPPRADFHCATCQALDQPLNPAVQHTRKIIISSHLSSAGGLPG